MSSDELSVVDRLIDIARGAIPPDSTDNENRTTRRCEHEAPIALVQVTPSAGKSLPTVVDRKNISPGGMCVISRYMLHVGYEGAVLMHRSNGELVMVGVKVVHCKYIGDMKHESGIEFIPVPVGFTMDDFRDEHGNMPQLGRSQAA